VSFRHFSADVHQILMGDIMEFVELLTVDELFFYGLVERTDSQVQLFFDFQLLVVDLFELEDL
jgi:hypothetical protein